MSVAAILRSKGSGVTTIAPDATVETAVAALTAARIGALVVSTDGRTGIGIFSERDVVRVLAERGAAALMLPVSSAMSAPMRTCRLDDEIPTVMGEMTQHRVRRSEEHTSELQSLMRISYAVFCWKKKQVQT